MYYGLLFLFAVFFTILTAILYGDVSFVLLITGVALLSFLYKTKYREIYLISFFANVIFGCILIGVFQENGSFFDLGGDDNRFYHIFLEPTEHYLNSRYGHYVYLGSTYVKGLQLIGLEPTPLLVYPLNWFIGANVCVCTFVLGKRFGLTDKRARVVAILLAIYPFFIFHEVKILRDILAAFLLILFILIYSSKKKLLLRVFGMLAIIAICSKVRGELILYMLLFCAIDYFFTLFYSKKRYQAFVLAFCGLVILALGFSTLVELAGRDVNQLSELAGGYQNLRDGETYSDSLGAQLKSAGVIFTPVVILYMWLSPFPPPVLNNPNAYTLIISIGVIFWYLAFVRMPFYIRNFYNQIVPKDKKTVINTLLIYILTCSAIIALISADSRHLIPFYPLIFILYELLRQSFPLKKVKYLRLLVVLGVVIIAGVYVFMKFFRG